GVLCNEDATKYDGSSAAVADFKNTSEATVSSMRAAGTGRSFVIGTSDRNARNCEETSGDRRSKTWMGTPASALSHAVLSVARPDEMHSKARSSPSRSRIGSPQSRGLRIVPDRSGSAGAARHTSVKRETRAPRCPKRPASQAEEYATAGSMQPSPLRRRHRPIDTATLSSSSGMTPAASTDIAADRS